MNNRKGFLNFLFVVAAGAGIFLIIRIDCLPGEYRFLYPVFVILVHGFFVGILTRKMEDEDFAGHHLDSVYFLGFLFTLVSLAVMFARFQKTGFEDQAVFTGALFYIGISVTTSIGGVLLRNILRGYYLKNHPGRPGAGPEGDYRQSLEMIRAYLEERAVTAGQVEARERQYAEALGNLNTTLGEFSRTLTTLGEDMNRESIRFIQAISRQEEPLSRAGSELSRFGAAADRVAGALEKISLNDFEDRLNRLSGEMGQLDLVVDSVIELLESKVERMKV